MFPSRRALLGLGATAAATAALSACSSQGGSRPGTLTLWTHSAGGTDEYAVIETIANDFNAANPGTKIQITAFPQAVYNDSIVTAAAAHELPDILDLDGPIMPNWAWSGYLAQLDLPASLTDAMVDSAKGYFNGALYSVGPYDTSLCFLARRSAFQAAGIAVPTIARPWTRDEFDAALKRLSELPDYELAVDMSVWDTAEWWPYAYAPMLQSFGGDIIDRDTLTTADGFLNGSDAVAFGTWFRSLFADGLASQTPGTDGTDFLQGKVPMVYAGGWKVLKAQETFGAEEVLILPPVDFGKGARVGGGSWQWAVSASSKNRETATRFIEFLMQDDYLVMYSDAIGTYPSIESAIPGTENYGAGKPLEPVYEIGKAYALLRPATPGYKVISSVVDKALHDIVSGADVRKTLDQAVKDIDADIRANDGYRPE